MATKNSCEIATETDLSEQLSGTLEYCSTSAAVTLLRCRGFDPTQGRASVVQPPDDPGHSIDEFLNRVANNHLVKEVTRGKRDSAGWMTSVVVHSLLIGLLAMLLAPVDLGGIDTHVLFFSFSDAEESEQDDDVMQVSVVEVESVPEEPSKPTETPPPPAEVTPQSKVAKTDLVQLGESLRHSGATGGSAGAAGSFFGIEARGRDFVYILDMSGSMRGRRYRRASAELVRSVEGLRDTQNFYVLLFNGGTVRMFNETSGYSPSPVAATRENKAKLSRWINTAFRGGSTDPRGALHLALRMRPSAIFMLSDGEFDDQKSARGNMIRGNSGAFSIVAAAADRIPINAIAFEDPTSCENMKRLAEMTDGEYRFAKLQDKADAIRSLAIVQQALDRGDKTKALTILRNVAANHGQTEAGWDARQRLAPMLYEVATEAMKAGNLQIARNALANLVEIDQQGDFSGELQHSLVSELLKLSQQSSRRDEVASNKMLADLIDRFPESKIAKKFFDQAAEGLLKEAEQLRAQDESVQSLMKLDLVLKKYPNTEAAKRGSAERQKITEDLFGRARKLRATAGAAGYARILRGIATKFADTHIESVANRELENLAIELLSTARDASFQRDWKTRDDANQQLNEGFSGDRTLARLRQEFSQNELKARELLRRAQRNENATNITTARSQYVDIIKKYGATLAAKKAKDRLRYLKPDIAVDDQNVAELMLMMQ